MHVDAHKEVDNFVLTYLKGDEIEEETQLAAITRKIDDGDSLDAVHYFPHQQSSEINSYALKTFYRSKFSDGLEGYPEKRNLTATGYELLSENIGNETPSAEKDTLVEEHGLEGAFEMLENGQSAVGDGGVQMSDTEIANRKADHFY